MELSPTLLARMAEAAETRALADRASAEREAAEYEAIWSPLSAAVEESVDPELLPAWTRAKARERRYGAEFAFDGCAPILVTFDRADWSDQPPRWTIADGGRYSIPEYDRDGDRVVVERHIRTSDLGEALLEAQIQGRRKAELEAQIARWRALDALDAEESPGDRLIAILREIVGAPV
jgi:hypothetical protein